MIIHTEGSPESCAESEDGSELLNEKASKLWWCIRVDAWLTGRPPELA